MVGDHTKKSGRAPTIFYIGGIPDATYEKFNTKYIE
jgi:hypothetical protein